MLIHPHGSQNEPSGDRRDRVIVKAILGRKFWSVYVLRNPRNLMLCPSGQIPSPREPSILSNTGLQFTIRSPIKVSNLETKLLSPYEGVAFVAVTSVTSSCVVWNRMYWMSSGPHRSRHCTCRCFSVSRRTRCHRAQGLMHRFTTHKDACMVLICLYYVNSIGSNI